MSDSTVMVTDHLINTIKDTYKAEVVETTAGQFSTRPLVPLPIATVQPETIVRCLPINTLEGIVDYLVANVDKIDINNMMLHITDQSTVNLLSAVWGKSKAREVFVQAHSPSLVDEGFEFNDYHAVEDFLIALKTLFVQTSAIEAITSIVGNIVESSLRTTSDDGVTQTVEIKRGIRRAEVDIVNPYVLQPFRTFREIEQPSSPFVLRLHGGGTSAPPQCALFEADGGAWKLVAMASIKKFFEDKEIAVPIIC